VLETRGNVPIIVTAESSSNALIATAALLSGYLGFVVAARVAERLGRL
jgi:hypothetical protein